MTSEDYKPVSCTTHSEYELAIMQKQKMKLRWQDEHGNLATEVVLPVDIITRKHAEYLIVKTSNESRKEIRLDMLVEALPVK